MLEDCRLASASFCAKTSRLRRVGAVAHENRAALELTWMRWLNRVTCSFSSKQVHSGPFSSRDKHDVSFPEVGNSALAFPQRIGPSLSSSDIASLVVNWELPTTITCSDSGMLSLERTRAMSTDSGGVVCTKIHRA